MKFKIDENLPDECASLLRTASFEADTVADGHLGGADDTQIFRQSQAEGRGAMVIVPSSVVETMGLSGVLATASLGGAKPASPVLS